MSVFGENSPTAYRNLTAIAMAIGLSSLLIWTLLREPSAVVSRKNIDTIVKEIDFLSTQTTSGLLHLQLPDNKTIKIYASVNPFPIVGDTMPIAIELYENGEVMYRVNYKQWLDVQLYN